MASREFASADLLKGFLKFVVETALDGNPASLKESVIGTQVFGRSAGFNPRSDPVVRMTARRVREKLDAYYAGTGAHAEIRIAIPKGRYVPEFVRTQVTVAPAEIPAAADRKVLAAAWPRGWRATGLGCLLIAGGYLLVAGLGRSPAPPPLLDSRPLTNVTGHLYRPALSRDGKNVAFEWDGPDGKRMDIWVQTVVGDTPHPITSHPAGECCPTWSPDGLRIAFLRVLDPQHKALVSVDRNGGGARYHAEIQSRFLEQHGLSWSPDGDWFATAERTAPGQSAGLVLVSLSGSKRRLTDPPQGIEGDSLPVFSPDGKQIAFRRSSTVSVDDVYVLDLEGGGIRRITYDNRGVEGFAWIDEGRSLLVSSKRTGSFGGLWRFPMGGGSPNRLTPASVNAGMPSVSGDGQSVVFAHLTFDVNIYELEPDSAKAPRRLIASANLDSSPQFSADGQRIAFRSNRSGADEVWIYDRVRQSSRRITNFSGPQSGSPRWAPDGGRIAFESRTSGRPEVYLMNAGGGSAQILTNEAGSHILPSWSRDGSTVYFTSNRSGRWEIWRRALNALVAEQVTHSGGFNAFESPDGKWLYYAKPEMAGVWRAPVSGGPEELLVPALIPNLWGNWALAPQGIFYIRKQEDVYTIDLYDWNKRSSRTLHTLTALPAGGDSGLAVSPDGRTILYCQVDNNTSNIVIADRRLE